MVVRPGKGREGQGFLTRSVDGHVYVLPTDALSLVAAGKVDRRLFDVTALAGYGYDDARRADVPLIVQYAPAADRDQVRTRLAAEGAVVKADLAAVKGLAVRAQKRDGARFWSAVTATSGGTRVLAPGIDRIWLDGKREVQLDESVSRIGAPAAWAAGYYGTGVTVALLDTGVDTTHPDLAGKVVAEANFTEAASADDEVGHGTHVASTIAGSGAASNGRYRGVAPAAALASGKVCADVWCTESAIVAGMQWAAVDRDAKIVNVSIGGWDGPELDPLEQAVNTLTAQYGTLFVISAGNGGPGGQTINSPGSADAALTVAAVDRNDQVADFSSRGPRASDGAIKPDISAPGVDIVAARATNGWIGDPVDGAYTRLSGTSMAAPHVAGAAALLASEHPGWGPELLKAALMGSALPLPGVDLFRTGTGRVDVARAVSQQVVAEPGSLSMGVQLWPHDDDPLVTRTVAYHNASGEAVTVALATEVSTPYGDPVPPGMFTLSATTLDVPAGGTAQATLTVNTRGGVPIGYYTGRIRASAGTATALTTPFVIEVEAERYAVTLRHTDAAGNPAKSYYTELLRTDMYDFRQVWDQPGAVTIRVPKATYALSSMVITDLETRDERDSMFTYPVLKVDRDITVDLDARLAKPLSFVTPEPAAPAAVSAGFDGRTAWGVYGWQFSRPKEGGITTLHLGPEAPRTEFFGRVEATLARPDKNGGFADSPYRYNLAWYTPGVLPTGFTGTVHAGDLATVHETYLAPASGLLAERYNTPFPTLADWLSPGWLYYSQQFAVPSSRTEYFLTRDVRWQQTLAEYAAGDGPWFNQWTSQPVSYQAGRRYDVRWYGGVLGPSTAGKPIYRSVDYLTAMIPLFSDGTAGHLGDSAVDTTRTALYRNGVAVAEDIYSPGYVWAQVTPSASDYRLTADVTRSSADVSTRISAAWTFESGWNGEDSAAVPVMAVRYRPALDDANTAPAGGRFTIPVTVEGAVDGVGSLVVQISYDDGVTWQPVDLRRTSDGWSASVTHPAGTGHVALRAQATDNRGNTVHQTIIRAYHFG